MYEIVYWLLGLFILGFAAIVIAVLRADKHKPPIPPKQERDTPNE